MLCNSGGKKVLQIGVREKCDKMPASGGAGHAPLVGTRRTARSQRNGKWRCARLGQERVICSIARLANRIERREPWKVTSVPSRESGDATSTCALKEPFDLCVQISRDFQSFDISIWSQSARHLVIAEVHTIWTLINQHGHGRIRPSIRHKPHHRLHDQWTSHNQAHALWVFVAAGLSENSAMIKPHELHETNLADAV